MARVPASEATRKRLKDMLAGANGVERSALMREAVRLIIEETLEAEVTEAVGRGYYDRGDAADRGQRVLPGTNCSVRWAKPCFSPWGTKASRTARR